MFVTGDVVGTDAERFLAESGCRWLAKPFRLNELLRLAKEVMGVGRRSESRRRGTSPPRFARPRPGLSEIDNAARQLAVDAVHQVHELDASRLDAGVNPVEPLVDLVQPGIDPGEPRVDLVANRASTRVNRASTRRTGHRPG